MPKDTSASTLAPILISTLLPSNAQRGLVLGVAADKERVVAVGGQGGDLCLVYDGTHYTRSDSSGNGLRGACIQGDKVWVAGEHHHIASTSDFGTTWETLCESRAGCLFGVVLDESGKLWAAGDQGWVGCSDDGVQFETVEGVEEDIARISNSRLGVLIPTDSPGHLYIAREGKIRKTALEAKCDLMRATVTSSGAVVVVGLRGAVFRSEDEGRSFARVKTPFAGMFTSVDSLPDGRVLIAGGEGRIFVSEDDGQSFSRVPFEGDGDFWCSCPCPGGVVLGGEDGLIVHIGVESLDAWNDAPAALDGLFAKGAAGFLRERLREFVLAQNLTENEAIEKQVEAEPNLQSSEVPAVEDDQASEEYGGEDAWKRDAVRAWRGLWSGTTADIERVWGVSAPKELVEFEQAVKGANPWSTFYEFRLDAGQMANPPEDQNLFEQLVFNDQLNYLGTGLANAFTGTVELGSLGNGDTYHLEVMPNAGPGVVAFWDHETHCFESPFADSLTSMVFLSALFHADVEQQVSGKVKAGAIESLENHVAPSWHFSMDDHYADFVPFEAVGEQRMVPYLHYRSQWIIELLKGDVSVDGLRGLFHEKLNPALDEEKFAQRLEVAKTKVATALYATWRAFLFEGPELQQLLEMCKTHPARIVRDSAKLIVELREGREELGRISNFPERLQRFRDLDLDPARAEQREAEEKESAQALKKEGEEKLTRFRSLSSAETVEDFVWKNWDDSNVRAALATELLNAPERREAQRGLLYLSTDSARGSLLLDEEKLAAYRHIAEHADAALQALLLGAWLEAGGELSPLPRSQARSVVLELARSGRLDPRALTPLRECIQGNVPIEENEARWRIEHVVAVLAACGDTASAKPLAELVARAPSDGGFETGLHFDKFIATISRGLRTLGDGEAALSLLPFAASTSPQFRDARAEAAYTLARLRPHAGSVALVRNLLKATTVVNDKDNNALALIAAGLMARELEQGERQELLDVFARLKPKAGSYVEVQVAQSLASYMLEDSLGGSASLERTRGLLGRCFTEDARDHKGTIQRRRWALEVARWVPGVEGVELSIDRLLALDDEELTLEALEFAERSAIVAERPEKLDWFSASDMDESALLQALENPWLLGRDCAARALAGHDSSNVHDALRAAVQKVMERAPQHPAHTPKPQDRALLREAMKALAPSRDTEETLVLMNTMLHHPNREVRGIILRDPPKDVRLLEGMRSVLEANWAWQAKEAHEWLGEHDS